jgi:hypothetical protein
LLAFGSPQPTASSRAMRKLASPIFLRKRSSDIRIAVIRLETVGCGSSEGKETASTSACLISSAVIALLGLLNKSCSAYYGQSKFPRND